MNETENIVKKSKSKGLVIGIAIAIAVVVFAALGTAICFVADANSTEKKLAKQLELGNKYLEEEDYERAIAAFEKAIEIDPKDVEAYIELANIYVEMGDAEKALSILGEARENVADEYKELLEDEIETIEIIETTETTETTGALGGDIDTNIYDNPRYAEFDFLQNPTKYDLSSPITVLSHGDSSIPRQQLDIKFSVDMQLEYNDIENNGNEKTYRYNGDLVKVEKYGEDGSIVETILFVPVESYDNYGDYFYEIYFNEEGEIKYGISVCHYSSDNHNLLETAGYDTDGQLTSYTKYVVLKYYFGTVRFDSRYTNDGKIDGYSIGMWGMNGQPFVDYDADNNIISYSIFSNNEYVKIIKR